MAIRYSACFLLLPLIGQAQPELPGFDPPDTVTVTCSGDTAVHLLTYVDWEAYQTLDDHWNGPRDSTVCIALAHPNGQWVTPYIDMDQVHRDHPVFVRWRTTDTTAIPLAPDNEYGLDMSVSGSPIQLDETFTCPDGACTGWQVAVRIPDEVGTGTTLRWYQAGYTPDSWIGGSLHLCVPTERFADNALRELVISVRTPSMDPGQIVYISAPQSLDFTQNGSLRPLTAATLPNYQVSPATYELFDWSSNYLVMYPDTTYPSEEHEGYLDLSPVPNTTEPQEVTLQLFPGTSLNFQPYTEFRGGLVEGSDSVRHPLHLINDGADICMSWEIVDLWWGPGDRYTHKSGHIDFGGANSCLLFSAGSTFELAAHSTMYLGREGRGILGLVKGSMVRIGPGAELVLQGIMSLKDRPGAERTEDMEVVLADGARLTFAPGCRVDNSISIDQRMRLHVVLDGGSVDLNGLSAEDRWKVYVTDLPREAMAPVTVLGNPIGEALGLDVAVRESGPLRLRAFDAVGRCVADRQFTLAEGHNTLSLSAAAWRSGAYLLDLRKGEEHQVLRFVKP